VITNRPEYIHELTRDQQVGADNPVVGRVRVRQCRIAWCDEPFANMFGYLSAELQGKPTRMLYASDQSHAAFAETANPVIDRGEIYRAELQQKRKDGTLGWYDIAADRASPESDEYRAAFIDVSACRKSWIALLGAEQHYRTLFAAMAEGVVVHARDGQVIQANSAAERILGLSRNELLGKTSHDSNWQAVRESGSPLPGEEHPASVTLRTGRPLRDQLMGVRGQNGGLSWLSVNSQPVYGDGEPTPSAVVVTFVDVTKTHAASEAIAKTLAEKELLLREVHHRVKNNLQVISSLLHLQVAYLDDANAEPFFLQCQNRIRSMALVHEHLYRSSSLTTIDFGAYLSHLAQLISLSHPTVHIVSDCDALDVGTDMAVPLGLIANELMTNVFKHAFVGREGGTLRLLLKQSGTTAILFSVADDGVGFPANFDVRATKSLGLRVITKLVHQIRATLQLREEKGGGSRVEISFANGV
jgi:PAS domain S-box-containing protein